MAAYVVVDIEVLEPVEYEEYKKLAAPTVTAYGGRYVARGGAAEVLEGDWTPNRLVVLEFPTVAQAQAWWSSPEYSPAKAIRQRTARTNMVLVAGV
ncbi:MAG: DUF1330 domain-containing protein [Chloroflexi bacterium]|nr:MAG: DUF1330 domain-containing protein [Chloroflexota bacterium]